MPKTPIDRNVVPPCVQNSERWSRKKEMVSKLYWVTPETATMPRPNGYDLLEQEIKNWHGLQINTAVSLLTTGEARELGLEQEGELCRQHGIGFIHFPIKDRQTPESHLKTKTLIDCLVSKANNKEKIVIHCRGGIGRASIIVGALLVRLGLTAPATLQLIAQARGLRVPDTEEQARWLADFEEKVKIARI